MIVECDGELEKRYTADFLQVLGGEIAHVRDTKGIRHHHEVLEYL